MFQWRELLVPQTAGRVPGGSPARCPSDLAFGGRPSSGASCPWVWRSSRRLPFPRAADCLFAVSCCEYSCTRDGRRRWVRRPFAPFHVCHLLLLLVFSFLSPPCSPDVWRRGAHVGRLWGPTLGGGTEPREGGTPGWHGCCTGEGPGNHQYHCLYRHHRWRAYTFYRCQIC